MKGLVQRKPNKFVFQSGYKILVPVKEILTVDTYQIKWNNKVIPFDLFQHMIIEFEEEDIQSETMTSIVIRNIRDIYRPDKRIYNSKIDLVKEICNDHKNRFIRKYKKDINDHICNSDLIKNVDVISMKTIKEYDKEILSSSPVFTINNHKLEYIGSEFNKYEYPIYAPFIYVAVLCNSHKLHYEQTTHTTTLDIDKKGGIPGNLVFLKFETSK